MAEPLSLELEDLSKSFGSTAALSHVNLRVERGEVRFLLGRNGSGKSTLVKLLSGYHRPETGRVRYDGVELGWPVTPSRLVELGVGFLHQDIGLNLHGTVLENLRITSFRTRRWSRAVRWRDERELVRRLLASFDLNLDPMQPVGAMTATERQMIGLIRAFRVVEGRDHGMLVLDEPTAALPVGEVSSLLDLVRRIAERGVSVLFVTHHLSEPLAIGANVSVLRDGNLIGTRSCVGLTESDLAAMVLGDDRARTAATPIHSYRGRSSPDPSHNVLDVRGLRGGALDDATFVLRRGEILGITGLRGSGHDEVLHLIFGTRPGDAGSIYVDGTEYRRRSPTRSRALGLALVSGDRVRAGGNLATTVAENLSIPSLDKLRTRVRRISRRAELRLVVASLKRYDVRPPDPAAMLHTLSGGNQQKVLVGRWMNYPPRLLLLDEPCAGVDVGAVDDIVGLLGEFTGNGGAALVVSDQYEDLTRLCHRVIVFNSGGPTHVLTGDEIHPESLLRLAYSAAGEPAVEEDL